MKKIGLPFLVFVVVLAFVYGLVWGLVSLGNKIEITPRKIKISRFDISLSQTKYLVNRLTSEEKISISYLVGTSVIVNYNEDKGGIYRIHYIGKYSLQRGWLDGIVEVSDDDLGGSYFEPLEKYKADFERAEQILNKTRERFQPIIEKELKK